MVDRQAFTTVWTTSITVFEIETGLGTMAAGKKQAALSQVFERILSSIDHRIAVFDEEAARLAANLTAFRQKKGRVGELRDTMIAVSCWPITHLWRRGMSLTSLTFRPQWSTPGRPDWPGELVIPNAKRRNLLFGAA